MRKVYIAVMIFGFAYTMVSLFMVTWLFYTAYFADGQTIYISVNNRGEADLEFWALGVLYPLALFFCFMSAKILLGGVWEEED